MFPNYEAYYYKPNGDYAMRRVFAGPNHGICLMFSSFKRAVEALECLIRGETLTSRAMAGPDYTITGNSFSDLADASHGTDLSGVAACEWLIEDEDRDFDRGGSFDLSQLPEGWEHGGLTEPKMTDARSLPRAL